MASQKGVVDLTAVSSQSDEEDEISFVCEQPNKRQRHNETRSDADSLRTLEAECRTANDEVRSLRAALSRAEARHSALEKKLKQVREARVASADAALDWTRSRPWDATLRKVCIDTLEAPTFRPLQQEALNATLARRDVFVVMPTGGGKSLVYQAAALVDGGITLVVSPLLALSEDQRSRLASRGVRAETLDSNTPKDVSQRIFSEVLPAPSKSVRQARALRKRLRAGDALAGGGADWQRDEMPPCILFVTPERIAKSKKLMARLETAYEAGHVSRIAVDEAHCCSAWGHDFRSDYVKLGVLRRQLPEAPILMLSATASPKVIDDVKRIMETPRCVVLRSSINRPNLTYSVVMLSQDRAVSDEIAELLSGRFNAKCGIVYVLSRKDSAALAAELRSSGIKAAPYHGDMEAGPRARVHGDWMSGKIRVVVATVAFGLGIDNQNVRFVIHACIPPSLEAYYQESGRAGRDGKPAECVAVFRASDFSRLSSFVADKGAVRLQLLYEIGKYVLGLGKCRRGMIAQAFGENRAKCDAAKCCDLCAGINDMEMLDVTEVAMSFVTVLDHSSTKYPDDKITINRAASDWANSGQKGKRFRGPGVDALGREYDKCTAMLIIIALVVNGAVREYHNYSTYSLNGYIVVGEMAQTLLEGKLRIRVPISRESAQKIREAHAKR